jgi:hypothetical protein
MKEAEVSWKKPRPEPASADEEDLDRYDEELKKVGRRDDDRLVIPIDQFRKSVGADLRYAWFPIDERPTVNVSASSSIYCFGSLVASIENQRFCHLNQNQY